VLIPLAIVAAAIGIGAAYWTYLRRDISLGRMSEPIRGTAAEILERKFYVDELYSTIFTRAGGRVADAMVWFDTRVIDGAVNGAGVASLRVGRWSRRVQTGLVRGYAAGFVLGTLVLVGFLLVQVR
jgi:NADH-quinone oxidoreductase subunit L